MSKESDRLPVQIDPFRLAQAGREYDGNIPLAHFKRLGQLLTQNEGQVRLGLKFGIDTVGVELCYMRGHIQTDLMIQCQRCLEPMKHHVDIDFSLAFVNREHEAEAIPAPYEPYVVEQLPVTLIDLIEDEILLALPGIPRHELEVCPARSWITVEDEQEQDVADNNTLNNGEHTGKTENPFSVLAQLKTPDKGK